MSNKKAKKQYKQTNFREVARQTQRQINRQSDRKLDNTTLL